MTSEVLSVDYGPLSPLIGVWQGDRGMDISPESDTIEIEVRAKAGKLDIYGRSFDHTDTNQLTRVKAD